MAKRSQAPFDVVSDEDSINTTTTAPSEVNSDKEYPVETVLAEQYGPDGQLQYLLKWERYPLYRSSWEKRSHIQDGILQDWERDKAAIQRGDKIAFDVNDFNLAVERWVEDVEEKKRRRIAKRRRRGEAVYSPKNEESSSDHEEFVEPKSPRRRKAKTSPIIRKGVAQPIAKRRKSAPSVEDGHDESSHEDESDNDSLFGESNASAIAQTPQMKTKTAAASTGSSAKQATKPQTTTPSLPVRAATRTTSNKQTSGIPLASIDKTSGPSNGASGTTGARKTAPAPTAKPAPVKRTSTSNVFAGDWTKERKRRERARVSGETSKDSTGAKFTHLSIQNRYRNYGKNEPAPDPNALATVDPKTGKVQPPKTVPARAGPIEIHNAYGRQRTPPRAVEQRAPSPPVPKQTRPVEPSAAPDRSPLFVDTNVENPIPPLESVKTFEPPTRKVTCKHWLNGTCMFTADTCRYAHSLPAQSPGGSAVPQPPSLTTCFYWRNSDRCRFSAQDCRFAHWDTGVYAGAPGTYMKGGMTPGVSSVKKPDLRLAAYPFPTTDGKILDESTIPEPVPSSEMMLTPTSPVGETLMNDSVPNDDNLTTSLTPVIRSPVEPMTKATDPRLAGRSMPATQSNVRPAEGPRLVQSAAVIQPISDSPMEIDSNSFTHDSIEQELEIAKQRIHTLDTVPLLAIRGGPKGTSTVVNTFIHMPPERAAESSLLEKFFTSFGCKVFTSQTPGHWKYFRSALGNPCLVVLHPSEVFNGTIPGLHRFLIHYSAGPRIFSIGVQHQLCIGEQREPAYEAQRVFPHGSFIFITDNVFAYDPEKATEIIEKFLDGTKAAPLGGEFSKIGARPGVKDWLVRLTKQKFDEQGGEGTCTDLRWIQCYEALCRLCPMEDEDPAFPDHSVPLETSHLWSVWEDSLPSFKGRWESGDEEGATEYMANHFAGEACSKVWRYRKFIFVYPGSEKPVLDSQGKEVSQPEDPKGWMQKYNHIGVYTPDAALALMKLKGK